MMEMKLRLEELHMEHEYQLRLKVMSYNEKIRELSDKLTQQTETMETMKQVCCSPTQQMRNITFTTILSLTPDKQRYSLNLQTTTTQMEKREREHQQSSAELAVKHSKELKDLGKKRVCDCAT